MHWKHKGRYEKTNNEALELGGGGVGGGGGVACTVKKMCHS